MTVQRVSYLDSLRGLAAMQVLLLHVFSAYFPDLVQSSPSAGTVAGYVRASPFFFIYDGQSAIYIFFVLSGYVLTAAFAASSATPGQLVTSRLVRLGVPALASCAFAAGLFLVFGGSNDLAGTITKSRWLADQWHPLPGQSFVRDSVANALLLGYRETSLLVWFGFPAEWLQPVTQSFNGPLWTLWIELYGSILIVVLSFLSRDKPIRWWAAVVLCALLFSRCALLCFVAGHVAARYELAVRSPMMNKYASGATIALGIFLCFRGQFWHPIFLDRLCALPATLLVPCISPAQVQLAVGATIIFLGVMQSVPLRKLLISPPLQLLGRLSFPIYLVHWPIVFGVSAFILIKTVPIAGSEAACFIAAITGILLTMLAALAFTRVDQLALTWSRAARPGTHPARVRPPG